MGIRSLPSAVARRQPLWWLRGSTTVGEVYIAARWGTGQSPCCRGSPTSAENLLARRGPVNPHPGGPGQTTPPHSGGPRRDPGKELLAGATAPCGETPPEEPDPPPSRKGRLLGSARVKSCWAAAACALTAPTLAAAGAPAANDGAYVVDIDATVLPGYALLSLAAAALGSYGAIAAESLIGYSPTRIAQMLDERRRPGKDDVTGELDGRDREYFVVAAVYAAAASDSRA